MKKVASKPIVLALAVTACGAALLIGAEPNPPVDPPSPRPPGGPVGPGAPGEPGGPRGQRFGQMQLRGGMGGLPIESVLDDGQRAEFRQAMNGQRDKLRELEEKNMKLRRQLDEAMLAKELDEKEVRRLSLALSEIEADRAVMRARAFAKVRPSLTEEQLERLKNLRADMGPGMRPGEGGFRPIPQRQFRPPVDREPDDVLPPPAPPRPPEKAPR